MVNASVAYVIVVMIGRVIHATVSRTLYVTLPSIALDMAHVAVTVHVIATQDGRNQIVAARIYHVSTIATEEESMYSVSMCCGCSFFRLVMILIVVIDLFNCRCVCGICACNASLNYGGEYCECSLSAVCPDNCTDEAHGTCQCGVCECKNGYEGANCNCSSLPCPNACSGNGDCLCSECHCAEGWAGADCACDLDLICPDCVHGSCCNYTSLGDSCLTSACGSCVCEQGWTGTLCDCSVAACPYNCHEHGEYVPCVYVPFFV